MIKSELILRLVEQNPHLYEREVEKVVNTILGQISAALVAGDRVELRGLGVFSVKTRNAREGRNPKTGAAVPIAEKKTVAFKPGKGMHARLNPSKVPTEPAI
jgi:integration host factor subunit beta